MSGYLLFPVFMRYLKQPCIIYTHDLVFLKKIFFSFRVVFVAVVAAVVFFFFPSVWLKLFVILNYTVGWESALGM